MDIGRRSITVSMAALAALGTRGAKAQESETWPARPVMIVTPFAAGASTEYMRLLAQKLTERFGKSVLIENRPGATGVIGTQLVANAKPDGYTFLLGSNSSHVIAPMLLEKKPYDPMADFDPISMVLRYPLVLVVNPELPFKTLPELIAYARSHPGKLNFASIGNGSGTHLTAEWFKSKTGLEIVHVAYKGGSLAEAAVMSGEVQMYFDSPRASLNLIRAGRLRPLAVSGPQRLPALQQVPTMAESGVSGMDPRIWIGLFAPKGTPSAILDKMGRAVRDVVRVPETRRYLEAEGTAEVVGSSPQELAAYIHRESKDWKELIDRLGIRAG